MCETDYCINTVKSVFHFWEFWSVEIIYSVKSVQADLKREETKIRHLYKHNYTEG